MIVFLRALPSFWVAVEELQRPELRLIPVIIGGLPHQRGAVREVNLAAQQRGLQPGMTIRQAHQQCPDGRFLVPDIARYDAVWRQVLDLLADITPVVESVHMGLVACDLQGLQQRWAEPWAAGADLIDAVYRRTGIALYAGVGANRLVAELASTMPSNTGVTAIEAGNEARFLADLPISLLPDLDPRLAISFQVLGLRTIGQLAALPAVLVARRFGSTGKRLHTLAQGIDPRPVQAAAARTTVSAERECGDASPEEMMAILHGLAQQCAEELQRRNLAGHMVELRLRRLGQMAPPRDIDQLPQPHRPTLTPSREPEPVLPIPYRIHSMLPQPGTRPATPKPGGSLPTPHHPPESLSPLPETAGHKPLKTTVRTAISEMDALFEQAQRLLLRGWTNLQDRLEHIELIVSEFEAPVQLGFESCLRLDQTGGLAGLGLERRRAIERQEQMLAARYGDAGFRHVDQFDPTSVLTERRVHWADGIGWTSQRRGA